ncbi:hypothetical protein [Thiospirillum jenense]|uniref:Uncharacterized protein n=1 Tax=Thiospirillum jenense TaxID=1653858 RepID=A0A839HCR4_9GAMM|nr:hypothetical protein [Thiospirillum jenense]MBB1125058.1 hypothetical protein [Thiospirillum jenense]
MSIEAAWFAEDCPIPVLVPHTVTALDIARWYAHGFAHFLSALSYCDALRTYLPVWRLPVPERWCFVPRSLEEAAMRCYRSAIREALVRGHGSASGHDIAAVLEEWAAAPVFHHPGLDGFYAQVLVDRTLELRPRIAVDATGEPPRQQYRVIGGVAHQRLLPPVPPGDCWAKEPDWSVFTWTGLGNSLLDAYFRHEGARPHSGA